MPTDGHVLLDVGLQLAAESGCALIRYAYMIGCTTNNGCEAAVFLALGQGILLRA